MICGVRKWNMASLATASLLAGGGGLVEGISGVPSLNKSFPHAFLAAAVTRAACDPLLSRQ
jgi:hypothetical protein